MERVNKILKHPIFLREQQRIKAFEKNRIYCGHQSEHLLDVARIGWIMILEAIRMHRTDPINEKNLAGILYRADKKSRACYCCESEPLCNWSNQKKNLIIQY